MMARAMRSGRLYAVAFVVGILCLASSLVMPSSAKDILPASSTSSSTNEDEQVVAASASDDDVGSTGRVNGRMALEKDAASWHPHRFSGHGGVEGDSASDGVQPTSVGRCKLDLV